MEKHYIIRRQLGRSPAATGTLPEVAVTGMEDMPPVDDREGGNLVSCDEKLAEKPADAARLFQAFGSAATTWW